MRRIATLASFVVLTGASVAYAADASRDSTVSVTGTAIIKLAPDQITVPLTISSEDADLSKSKDENDKKVKKILSLADKYGVGKDDVQTTYHSVEPEMSYGNNVTVETDVYTGSVSYTINVQGVAQDKIDALIEALQKADIENVNFNNQQSYSQINGSYNVRDDKVEVVRTKLKDNQEKIIRLVTAGGVARDKIGINTNQGKGKETRSQPYKQHVEKYKAVVSLNVVMKDKEKAVDFVNAALKEGVENVGSITFGLKDEKAVQDKASLEALKDAKRKATAIADAMGVGIDRPLSISANGAQVMPIQPYRVANYRNEGMFAAKAMVADSMQAVAEPSALPTGQIEVNASVNATFLLKQK